MKNLLLSVALIAVPVAVFSIGYRMLQPAAVVHASAVSLGDMSRFEAIVTDVQAKISAGDSTAAKTRVTDLETAWDEAQASMQPLDPVAWGTVDGAIDATLRAVRGGAADAADTLVALQAALADPSMGGAAMTGGVTMIKGVVTTDAAGRTLPCEVMLDTFRSTLAQAARLSDSTRATIDDLGARGTERCNADDDTRAADFFAQGIALMSN